MPSRPANDPDYWISELKPLLQEIDTGLRRAVPKARRFFSEFEKTEQINKPLLSNLIRYYTLEYLRANNHQVVDSEDVSTDDDGLWAFKSLSNNGIEIIYRGSRIRLRKGIDPPLPNTESSRDFYQQVLSSEFEQDIVANLIVLWNLNAKGEYDGHMELIRPRRIWRKNVLWDFRKRILIEGVDLNRVVSPEYSMPSDLPIDPAQDKEPKDKTGTDDADKR